MIVSRHALYVRIRRNLIHCERTLWHILNIYMSYRCDIEWSMSFCIYDSLSIPIYTYREVFCISIYQERFSPLARGSKKARTSQNCTKHCTILNIIKSNELARECPCFVYIGFETSWTFVVSCVLALDLWTSRELSRRWSTSRSFWQTIIMDRDSQLFKWKQFLDRPFNIT